MRLSWNDDQSAVLRAVVNGVFLCVVPLIKSAAESPVAAEPETAEQTEVCVFYPFLSPHTVCTARVKSSWAHYYAYSNKACYN